MKNKKSDGNAEGQQDFSVPSISLPKGGGAIKGIEEKFQVNAVTGTSAFGIPIPLSPSRHGFIPAIGLNYNSGSGNSPFGLGWDVGIPGIARKTEKQLPQYKDDEESDTFILPGAEDLVPLLEKQDDQWIKYSKQRTENGNTYTVTRYRPRIEGSFARIEKWKNNSDGDTHWRTISTDNIHSYYGLTPGSRISDPHDTT
ncbi:MAG: SpvB/TcaC N-terminal domain-containing protein, partial [Candidatus Aminicenantes bacterium]